MSRAKLAWTLPGREKVGLGPIRLDLFCRTDLYYFAKLIDKSKSRKLILIISIICNIGLLVVFKYTDFIISIFNFVFRLDIKSTNIALPIGISFYTFQILSYVIDVYRKKVKVQNNIINF